MDVSSAGERLQRTLRQHRWLACVITATLFAAIGCASPGPPRAPSLGLPEPVRDLAVTRIGNTVELRFTAPSRTTDKLALRGPTVTGQFCRELEHKPCVPILASRTVIPIHAADTHTPITWTDTLPADLTHGDPHLLGYRVEFFSHANRSAGPSAPAFTADGAPPAPIDDLHAQGSRLGVVLSWNPSSSRGDVVLQREDLALAPPKAPGKTPGREKKQPSAIQWLGTQSPGDANTNGSSAPTSRTLDTTAAPDTPYRYIAERRLTLHLGTHPIELRSAASAPITFTLHETYAPPTPTGVTAVGYFANGASSPFAADIIWQPVDDAGLIAPLAGYNLYRESLTNTQTSSRARLNTAPIPTPAFHDTTADPATRYRYSITAVDNKGNESPAAFVTLDPSTSAGN